MAAAAVIFLVLAALILWEAAPVSTFLAMAVTALVTQEVPHF